MEIKDTALQAPSARMLSFYENSFEAIGYVDQHARWTCNVCGIKDAETGCRHLLEWLARAGHRVSEQCLDPRTAADVALRRTQ